MKRLANLILAILFVSGVVYAQTHSGGGGGGGANPGGSGTQVQYRSSGTAFGGVGGTAVGAGGAQTWTASGDAITPLSIVGHSATQSAPLSIFNDEGTTTPGAAFEFMGIGAGDAGDGTIMLTRFAQESVGVGALVITSKDAPGYYGSIVISDTSGAFSIGANNPPSDSTSPYITLRPSIGDIEFYDGSGDRSLLVGANQVVSFDMAGGLNCHAFSNLPLSLAAGTIACVTDSTTNVPGSIFAGSGAYEVLGWFDGSNWRVGANSTGPVVLSSALATTAATSDNVTITGMTSSGHCTLSPTNALAATNVATTYISAKTTNQITVTHGVTSGMDFDIICTTN